IAWKLWQRQRLLSRSRRIPRISVEELENLREQGQLPVILDVRAHHEDEPSGIPGAIPVELNVSLKDLPGDLRDASIVIYCACPHELSAAMLAQRLNASGFTRTWALAGGLDAWRKAYGQVVANT
ncbi:thiosulfate sulfurtransferase GlpE, partial [Pseudomonas aeruginosa]